MTQRAAQTMTDDELAAQFRDRNERVKLALPTGKIIYVTDPDLPTLALQGHIPNHLLPIVEKFVMDQNAAITAINEQEQKPGEKLVRYAEYLQYVDCFVVAAAVAPRFSLDGKAEGTLSIKLLTQDEKLHVWRWSAGLVSALGSFPDDGSGPDTTVAELSDGEGVRQSSVGAVGSDDDA